MEKAIKRAIKGGWRDNRLVGNVGSMESYEVDELALLDRRFWQALGKAEGWGERYCTSGCGCPYPSGDGSHEYSCVWEGDDEWKNNWHSLIDHLASGKDADSFFNSLLK